VSWPDSGHQPELLLEVDVAEAVGLRSRPLGFRSQQRTAGLDEPAGSSREVPNTWVYWRCCVWILYIYSHDSSTQLHLPVPARSVHVWTKSRARCIYTSMNIVATVYTHCRYLIYIYVPDTYICMYCHCLSIQLRLPAGSVIVWTKSCARYVSVCL